MVLGSVRGPNLVHVGVKKRLLGHLRGEENTRGRQGASRGRVSSSARNAFNPFWPEFVNCHLRFGVPCWCNFGISFWPHFWSASGVTSGLIWAPFWGPKTVQEEPREEPKSSQDECAAENAAKAKTCISPRRELAFGVLEWPKSRLS